MFTIQQSVTIARPVEEVFAFLADPASIPRWRPDILETRSGGPMHQRRSSVGGMTPPSAARAYWMHRVMPGLGSVRVPSRSKKTAPPSWGCARVIH